MGNSRPFFPRSWESASLSRMKTGRALGRRQFTALALVLAGCGSGTRDDAPQTPVVARKPDDGPNLGPVTAHVPPARRLQPDGLRFDDAYHDRAPRGVLYSWTTTEQATALRQDRVLFTKTARDDFGPGFLYQVLGELSAAGNVLAQELAKPGYAKGRYAWVNPWAASLGFQGEEYGTELLRIELRPEARFVRIFRKSGTVDVVGVDGKVVPTAQALNQLDLLAGAYFVNEDAGGGGSFATTVLPGTYRELYVGNLAMVARWSLGTQAIVDVLRNAAAALRRLAPFNASLTENDAQWKARVVLNQWRLPPLDATESYESSLCFVDPSYRPTQANLEALARHLETRIFTPEPLEQSYP